MSQAKNPHTTNLSRRTAIAGISGAVALSTVGKLLAARAGDVDPIFAIMEEHDRAMVNESACGRSHSDVEGSLPRDRMTWKPEEGERMPPKGCTDAPEWIEAQLAMSDTYVRRNEAIVALLTTQPTTLQGAIALLGYVGSVEYPYERGAEDVMLFVFPNIGNERVGEAAVSFPARLAETMLRLLTV
jgi:hypothetical protein